MLFGAAPCETRYVEQQFGEAIDGKKEGRRQVPPCNLHPSRPCPSGCVMPGRVTPSSQSSTIFAAMLMEIEDAKRRPLQSQFGGCQEAEQVNGSRQAAAQALPASRLGLPTESPNVISPVPDFGPAATANSHHRLPPNILCRPHLINHHQHQLDSSQLLFSPRVSHISSRSHPPANAHDKPDKPA